MSPKRIQRINQLLKRELSQILLDEFDFPHNVLVTLTRVDTSADLRETKVYVSVMQARQNFAEQNLGELEKEFKKIIKILNQNLWQIQQKINKRLKMKIIPKIKFVEEEKTKEAARIEEILEKIKNDKNEKDKAT